EFTRGRPVMAKTKRKTKATGARSRKSKKKTAAKSAARTKARKPQRFVFSHHREQDFDQGLRPYSACRDLALPRRRLPDGLRAEGVVPKRIRRPGRAHVSRRLMLDPAAQDQAHRARLFRRLRASRNR